MAKKKSTGKRARKAAKKAIRDVKAHSGLTAAAAAIGGAISSVFTSEKFRGALGDLFVTLAARGSAALKDVSKRAEHAVDKALEAHNERDREIHA